MNVLCTVYIVKMRYKSGILLVCDPVLHAVALSRREYPVRESVLRVIVPGCSEVCHEVLRRASCSRVPAVSDTRGPYVLVVMRLGGRGGLE